MKKLMFVAALAASAAAFAEGPINATAFANSAEYNPNTANSYFYFAGDLTSDSSFVTNDVTTASTNHTANFATATDSNYLVLDTEGSTLWRSLNTINSASVDETTTYSLGTATNVAQTGTYLDTLVQFTVTEDDPPAVGEGDKLAIWLQADETTGKTNLMVRAGWTADGSLASGGTNFVLSGVTVQPGEWYRLTVKAYENILIENEELKFPAFSIFIDGTEVGVGGYTIDSTFAASLSELYLPGMASKVENGTVFLSCVAGEPGVSSALQGVGFQGTGAVDEIVWTEEDPFPAATVEFTLTYTAGDANVTLGAVTYTVGEDPAQTVTSGGKVPEGATVSIAATFAEGYQLAAVTTNGAAVAGATLPYTFTMTADMTVAITSEAEPVANPTVDGQTVEPANVFNTAASNKPIIYPSAPTIAGEVGSQTITFNGTTVSVPAYYTATLDGTTVTLALNDNALPTIGDETVSGEAKDAIEVGATTFTATLTSTNEKLYYGLKSAATVNAAAADWTVGTLTKGTGAPMQITADKPTVNENAASAGFFKVYVTDVPPAAEPVVEP